MRSFLIVPLYLISLAILPSLAFAHGSSVFEGSEHEHHAAATHDGHTGPADEFEELHEQIEGLEARLIAYEDRIRVTDIVGGIGYIVGIAGVAYYYLGARRRTPE